MYKTENIIHNKNDKESDIRYISFAGLFLIATSIIRQ